ncbi:hypothetical protein B1R32_102189 [Abditibacterium utsteinense]|uniref:Uncharacterized protein n=1 Tax=Abditibacterium utsteinense TaxID=1960156 RepID=A0A2S8SWJ8_9BACT|nr:hypothetical protein [Abditibacterium utsteinense]PQV65181.1 hypothetical protein B1R32_102189 [Abditibacterium utsteinense]
MSRKFDDYLARVERGLRALPTSVRESEVREICAHLEQLIEDDVASGQNLEMATQNALSHFGDARGVVIGLRDVWEAQRNGVGTWAAALASGVFFWAVSFMVWSLCLLRMIFSPQSALFPELPGLIIAWAAFIPLATGAIFSLWLGRRGWMASLAVFTILGVLFFGGQAWVGPFRIQLPWNGFLAVSFPLFNLILGCLGAMLTDIWRRHRHFADLILAMGAEQQLIAPPKPRVAWRKVTLNSAGLLLFITIAVMSAKWRVETTLHPKTPLATLRNSLLLDGGGTTGFEAPQILDLRELPAQTPSERAGRERRVAFRVEARATQAFAANQITFLKRKIELDKTGGNKVVRAALARVQNNRQTVEAAVRLVKTPSGWQIDEMSFDSSKLHSWFYDRWEEM